MNFKLKRKLLSVCATTLICSLAFSTATFAASSSTPQSTTATSTAGSQATELAETAEDSIAFYLKDIPDSVFRNYLKDDLKLGNNEDGSVTVKECEAIKSIYISNTGWFVPKVKSLSGIEHFTNLERLTVYSNALTSLDISKNQNLKEVELRGFSVDSFMPQNSNLENLTLYTATINSLDTSKLFNLKSLVIVSSSITSLDISKNSTLESVTTWKSGITSLDVSQNPNLNHLGIFEDQITSLDISKNTKLKTLGIAGPITSLDVSQHANLESLELYNTLFTTLDVSHNPKLRSLNFESTAITYLDVSNNTELEFLRSVNSKLTSLNTLNNPNLEELDVSDSELVSLNISNTPLLSYLNFEGNHLAGVNLDNVTSVAEYNMACQNQTLNDEKLQTTTVTDGVYSLDLKPILKDNDVSRVTFSDSRISYDKATGIASFTDTRLLNTQVSYNYQVANGKFMDVTFTLFAPPANGNVSMDVFTNANFKWYLKNKCGLDKDNDGFATKEELNAVTNIDISYDVFPNYVTSLNGIEYLPNLETLAARRQPYTVLDVSKNTNLKTLDVSQSALTVLDVTNNANLEALKAQYAALSCIDISQNRQLNTAELDQNFYNRNRHTATYEDGVYQLNLLSTFKGGDRRRPIFEDSRVQYDPYLGKLTFTDETILNSDITYTYNTGNPDFGMKVSMHVYAQDVNMDVFTNANFKWYLKNKCGLDKDNDGFATQAELNAVKNIDVSYDVFPNYVTSLAGIEYLPNLETLAAKRQPYTELNVSKNTNLKELNVAQSALTSLDVTKNTNLQVLNAQFAGLSCIDLSQNKSLNSAQLDQTIYNKSKYPITYVGGTYQVNLASTLPNGDISKISFDDSRIEYDSSTGIMTFTDKSILNNNITYMYNTGNPDFRMNVLVHIYD